MIEQLTGRITLVGDNYLVIQCGGIGLRVNVCNPEEWPNMTEEQTICIAWTWNQEKGPALYGFTTPLHRWMFYALIDCPKIGPSTALQLLAQASPDMLMQIIASQDEKALAKLKGVGPKSAQNLILYLKDKIAKLPADVAINLQSSSSNFSAWNTVQEALFGLGYSNKEITQAFAFVKEGLNEFKDTESKDPDFDYLLRQSLAFFVQQKNMG